MTGRRREVISVALICCVTGCAEQPIKNPFTKEKPLPSERARARPLPAVDPPDAVSPVSRMTVNHETVEAAEIWKGERLTLAGKAQALTEAGYRQFVHERAAMLINERIAEMLLYQASAARLDPGVQPALDRLVDEQLRKIITAEYRGIQRKFERYLESTGMTLMDYRRRLEREMVIARFLELELKPRIAEPTRAELAAFFDGNRDEWRKTARRSMSLIDVRIVDRLTGDAARPTREELEAARVEARRRIGEALEALDRGESFADVARRYSDGLNAAEGGAWGWVSRDSVRERFLPAVEALERMGEGEVSGIVETPEGFFLVRCDQFEPGYEPDFQSVQPTLKDRYFRSHYNRLVEQRVQQLRERARIAPKNLERFHAAVVAEVPDVRGQ